MRIALDYDLTYTLDPDMWDNFIAIALNSNHDIRIVTARSPIHDVLPQEFIIPVIYCDGVAKKFHCTWFADDGEGWLPDVWIDDKPENITNNSTATRDSLAEWRASRDA